MARRILVRTLSLLLVAVAGLALVGCPGYYYLLVMLSGSYETNMGGLVISMTLNDVSTPLTYYQDHMADAAVGTAEYSWGVRIDYDADMTTGDPEGFDTILTVQLETGGDTTVTEPLTALMVDLLPEMSATLAYYQDGSVEPEVWEENVPTGLAGNTLYIGASPGGSLGLWWETDPDTGELVPPTFRARFFARYNDPSDPATEIVDTVDLFGPGTQSDPAEDVSYSFIDIVEVRVDNLLVGEQ